MRTRVPNSLSARIGSYSLHNSLFREAMDTKTSTINFDILRAIFAKHFPLLSPKEKNIEITVLERLSTPGQRDDFEIVKLESVKVSKHARNRQPVKRKPRAKPVKQRPKK